MKRVLVTGSAGFIGFHVSQRLLDMGYSVLGLDNLNPFYNEGLKAARLEILRRRSAFEFVEADIADRPCVEGLFARHEFGPVIHLAAQAGVRYSLENPYLYVQSNLAGFVNLIEEARKAGKPHFVYASSSSVYGANTKIPFSEQDNVDFPISLYAASKKSNELIAHVYAHLYRLPVTGLRFFTVYGPWGRPDMAMFKFCKAIFEGATIDVYNHGEMRRDFTYVDDVVEGIIRVMEKPPDSGVSDGAEASSSPYRVFNIGNNQPVDLAKLIRTLEEKIGKKAVTRLLPMQPGDVPVTYADIDNLSQAVGYRPKTPIEEGVSRFVDWYRGYYKV
ncbi:MAG TPA: NAD-dependent epimerase [Candidatus Angelobacter sp.]|nr:NAD-dependent epimerase [Candidatus Angelobacter sp.]